MVGEVTNNPQHGDEENVADFQLARFQVELGLPDADAQLLKEAATAVRQEFRGSAKWKRLRCKKVDVVAEKGRGTVFILQVNKAIDFDWTWEGAVAFRPAALDGDYAITNEDAENILYGDENTWSGEVLEVDEQNGCLFVSMDNPEAMPVAGDFFVQPFEFLATLDSAFREQKFAEAQRALPSRLNAAQGGVHPQIIANPPEGSALLGLSNWWRHSWSVLWGPPGTGKSWTTGHQIAAAMSDPTERILVTSTTNKATDAVALYVGKAIREQLPVLLQDGKLLRIGKGADLSAFQKQALESMLVGTESLVLHEISELVERLRKEHGKDQRAFIRKQIAALRTISDRSNRLFVDSHVRIIASTAFKATSLLQNSDVAAMIAKGEAPFTTIFIDEAGLLSRAAIAALSLLAARRVVLVGDSKQLAPISRVSRILPKRQQRWLARSGLSHLDELEDTPQAVHVLYEQRRMHSDVCNVVSKYQYRGALTTAVETKQRVSMAPSFLTDFSRVIWYVLDGEAENLSEIRAERGPGNKSFVREITFKVLQKLFSDKQLRASNGLFISPFRAQAHAVSEWLAFNELPSWKASTVHSQQGGDEDIVIFDTVYASNTAWPIEEWQRLVNVGLSRTREAMILLASRAEMNEPYLRQLKPLLRPGMLNQNEDGWNWVSVSPNACFHSSPDKSQAAESAGKYSTDSMGRQIAERKKMPPIFSREQQRLTNINLDGKPRLVRGVAGSGKSIVLSTWIAKTIHRLESEPDAKVWAVFANRSLHKLLQDSIENAWKGLANETLFEPREFPWNKVALLHIREVLEGILPSMSLSVAEYDFDYDRAAEEFLSKHNAETLFPLCTALFIDEAQDMGHSTLKLLLAIVEQSDVEDSNSKPAHIFFDNAQNIYGRKTPRWTEFGLDLRGRATILKESFRSTRTITELAVNVLHRLNDGQDQDDEEELRELGLIHPVRRDGEDWLVVNFSHVDGPSPILQLFPSRRDEMERIGLHLKNLIKKEEISPCDITLLYVGEQIGKTLESSLSPILAEFGVELSLQSKQTFERRENTLIATTPHSFKGYESEFVIIPCVDQYVTSNAQILARPLYVAMTRARSLLAMYGLQFGSDASARVVSTLTRCIDLLDR